MNFNVDHKRLKDAVAIVIDFSERIIPSKLEVLCAHGLGTRKSSRRVCWQFGHLGVSRDDAYWMRFNSFINTTHKGNDESNESGCCNYADPSMLLNLTHDCNDAVKSERPLSISVCIRAVAASPKNRYRIPLLRWTVAPNFLSYSVAQATFRSQYDIHHCF